MKRYPVSRRDFISGGAATIAGMAFSPILSGCRDRSGQSEYAGEAEKNLIVATSVGYSNNTPGSVILWRYDGKGGYEPVYEQPGLKSSHSIAMGDADNDGKQEVVAVSRGGSYVIGYDDGQFLSRHLDEFEQDTQSVVIGDADNDGLNEILIFENGGSYLRPPAAKLHVYRHVDDGKYEKVDEWPGLVEVLRGNGIIADVDGDGLNDVLTISAAGGLVRSVKNDDGFRIADVLGNTRTLAKQAESYRQLCGYQGDLLPLLDPIANQKIDYGDLIGDGSHCILLPGFQGRFQVIRHNGDGYEVLHMSEPICDLDNAEYPRSCRIGDVNNDGRNEAVFGAKTIMVYGHDGKTFRKMWESGRLEGVSTQMNVSDIQIADSDGDGMNEVIYAEPAGRLDTYRTSRDGRPSTSRLSVMKNSGEKPFGLRRTWQSDTLPGSLAIAVGDMGMD